MDGSCEVGWNSDREERLDAPVGVVQASVVGVVETSVAGAVETSVVTIASATLPVVFQARRRPPPPDAHQILVKNVSFPALGKRRMGFS